MKNISIFLSVIILTSILFLSCEKEKQTYPGVLIKHGLKYLYLPLKQTYGSDDRVYAFSSGSATTDLSSLSGTDFTYEFWIKADDSCSIGNRLASSGLDAGGACISERRNNFELYLVNAKNGGDFAIKYARLNSDDDFQQAYMISDTTGKILFFNQWVHVAISRSSADNIAKFYINGDLVGFSADSLWIQPVNDTWLDINYMYRGSNMNFFVGGIDLYRVSKIDRYPSNFTPSRDSAYSVDENTLLQLNLDKHLTPFSPATSFDKIEIFGSYTPYIKVHNSVIWETDSDVYYPLYQ